MYEMAGGHSSPSYENLSRPTRTDDLVGRLVSPATSSNERRALEAWAKTMVQIFQDDPKNSYIFEAAHLSWCAPEKEYVDLLTAFSNVIIQGTNDGNILESTLLTSFAHVLRRAPSTLSAETARLGSVLQCLQTRLENAVKRAEIETQYQLVYMLSVVLDAMVDIRVSGLSREGLHEPLLKQLEPLKNHREPRLSQAARYAYQALLGVPDDESPYEALWRYSCTIINATANISAAVMTMDVTKFLSATPALMELLSLIKKIAKAAPGGPQSRSLQSLVDGMISLCQQKRWYTALRYTELLIEIEEFDVLTVFIERSPCREDESFFCGLFAQLELAWMTGDGSDQKQILQLAALLIRQIRPNWRRAQDWVKLVAGTMEQSSWRESFCKNRHRLRIWKNKDYESRLSRFPTEMIKTHHLSAKLLESAWLQCHEAQQFYADSRIRHYYTQRRLLDIKRLSGDLLDMAYCYINLAIIEHEGSESTKELYGDNVENNSSAFTLFSRLKVKDPDMKPEVVLQHLFRKREKSDGSMVRPRRILIRGRAGVGKTTLCKRIVHDFIYERMWEDEFDRVLWVPLRKLKERSTLQQFIYDEYFSMHRERDILAPALWKTICDQGDSRTLFILDGLDEISGERNSSGTDLVETFKNLLNRQNVIITSRPHAVHLPVLEPFDLELETVGFHSDQVDSYLSKVVGDEDTAREMRSFIQSHWLIQGLVQIPIQLDALCYSWDSDFSFRGPPETMTALYQAIELKLWTKDILQLGKPKDSPLSEFDLPYVSPAEILSIIEEEDTLLQFLAFTGIYNDIIEFNAQHRDEVYKHCKLATPLLSRNLVRLSFLRTADSSAREKDKSYHFLHLTFQEYFAAKYFLSCWKNGKELLCFNFSLAKQKRVTYVTPEMFLQQEKYNGRYDIFWRFVSGLLQDHDEERLHTFFEMLRSAPSDLLGPGHQRILMHCLSEVPPMSSFGDTRTEIENQLKRWAFFEYELHKKMELCRGMEFPDHLLDTMLEEGAEDVKEHILKILRERAQISPCILNRVSSFLENGTPGILTSAALYALGNRDAVLPERILRAILARLHDPEATIRRHAIAALSQRTLPEHIVQEILHKLDDTSADTRESAARALYKQRLPDRVLQVLMSQLDEADADRRQIAVGLLGSQCLPEHILQKLICRLQDIDPDTRISAVKILGNQELPDNVFLDVLFRIKDPDETVRSSVLDALHNRLLSDDLVRILVSYCRDINEDVAIRERVLCALSRRPTFSDANLQEMATQLRDTNALVRNEVLWVLINRRSPLPENIVREVVFLLEDPDEEVRYNAQYTLRGLTLRDKALQDVISQLSQFTKIDPDLRETIVYTLCSKTSVLQADVLQKTLSRLGGVNAHDRIHAMSNLAKETTLPQHVLPLVTSRLEDSDRELREEAANVLRNQTTLPEHILRTVVSRLEDTREYTRYSVVDAIVNRADLPVPILQMIVDRLPRIPHRQRLRIMRMLMSSDYLYDNFPGFGTEVLRLLYGAWIQRSFDEQFSCYVQHGSLYINMSEGRRTIPLASNIDRVISAFQQEAAALGSPMGVAGSWAAI
ncbi:hypothetical protein DTO166G4_4088 [Paecilomyces variotii]|nr:hypothetical protein DTO166G4_4088 [Paecilomyces variotii]KAJ9229892.1 hypothetical protein DTO166G5_7615 [Paecilomyces variotii]KAJ9299489.1 hypothetical protein DTO217A2_8219 [Paecilomyces variotii]KAJ9369157.1 hypothetical protein DTO282E5_6226 [Paecilomyces variotii]